MEIGFDILKACDVPEEVVSQDESASTVPEALRPSGDAAAAVATTAATAAPGEKTAAATSTVAKAPSAGSAASSTGVPGDTKKESQVADDKGKRYRLMVKRRLLKRHGEELSTDATTRKRQLEELYRDVEAGLFSLGAKLRKEEEGKK